MRAGLLNPFRAVEGFPANLKHLGVNVHQRHQLSCCPRYARLRNTWHAWERKMAKTYQVSNGEVFVGLAFSADDIQDACA